jgi:hypothetical protein
MRYVPISLKLRHGAGSFGYKDVPRRRQVASEQQKSHFLLLAPEGRDKESDPS